MRSYLCVNTVAVLTHPLSKVLARNLGCPLDFSRGVTYTYSMGGQRKGEGKVEEGKCGGCGRELGWEVVERRVVDVEDGGIAVKVRVVCNCGWKGKWVVEE
jgi:hypothetical protein